MNKLSNQEMPYERRDGLYVRELTLDKDNVYILDQLGRLWRVWIEYDHPSIELLAQK